jgi:opacity protein-like surface antigen
MSARGEKRNERTTSRSAWACLTGVVAAASLSALNVSAESRWHLAGSVGGYIAQDTNEAQIYQGFIQVLQQTPPPNVFTSYATLPITANGSEKFTFSPGIDASLSLGYDLSSRIRLDSEIGYVGFRVLTVRPYVSTKDYPSYYFPEYDGRFYTPLGGGAYSRYMASVNARYTFSSFGRRFAPFLNGGVGVSVNTRSGALYQDSIPQGSPGSPPALGQQQFSYRTPYASHTEGFGVVGGGLSLAMDEHWSLEPSYRYLRYFGATQESAHVVRVALSYRF